MERACEYRPEVVQEWSSSGKIIREYRGIIKKRQTEQGEGDRGREREKGGWAQVREKKGRKIEFWGWEWEVRRVVEVECRSERVGWGEWGGTTEAGAPLGGTLRVERGSSDEERGLHMDARRVLTEAMCDRRCNNKCCDVTGGFQRERRHCQAGEPLSPKAHNFQRVMTVSGSNVMNAQLSSRQSWKSHVSFQAFSLCVLFLPLYCQQWFISSDVISFHFLKFFPRLFPHNNCYIKATLSHN